MTTIQQRAIEIGLMSVRRQAGVTVSYVREGAAAVELTAIPGSSPWDQVQDTTVVREMKSQDWIFKLPAAWIAAGTRPRAGDRITRDGSSEIHEVMAPGGEQPWKYMGPSENWVRVFTKQVTELATTTTAAPTTTTTPGGG
jgi:hypothetical protein